MGADDPMLDGQSSNWPVASDGGTASTAGSVANGANAEAGASAIARYRNAETFAFANPGGLSLAVIATCVLLALLTLAGDAQTIWARQYAWGLQVNEEIEAGEWWRLLSAAFLHENWWHLIANMYALFVVGSVVERALGWPAFLAIYVLAGLGGNIASYYFLDVPSLGASGAIFGLFGAAIWLIMREDEIPGVPLSRDQLRGLGAWAAYSLFMGFTEPHINNAAHLGGLVTGAAVAAVLPIRRVTKALATLCATMLVLTGVRMALTAREAPRVAAYLRAVEAQKQKDVWSAMVELDRAVPFPAALELRAAMRLDNGNYRGALEDADALLATGRRGESHRRAHYYRAHALLKLGRPAEAYTSVQTALETRNPRGRELASELEREILLAVPDSAPHLPGAVRGALQLEPAAKSESVSTEPSAPAASTR